MKKTAVGLVVLLLLCVSIPVDAWNLGSFRHQPLIMLEEDSWEHERFAIVQTGTGELFLEVPHLNQGEILSAVYLMWQGAPGHTANPIGTGIVPPWLEVYAIDASGVEHKLCWGQDDPLQTPAEYAAPHVIVASDCNYEHVEGRARVGARVLGAFTTGWHTGDLADFQAGGRILSLRTLTY